MAMPPDFFDEYVPIDPATCDNHHQSTTTASTATAYNHYYAPAGGSVPVTSSVVDPAWCQAPVTMPNGGCVTVGTCVDSYTRPGSNTKSPTPDRRSSTRTASTASSTSTKMSSRTSVSSKSSAPSESSASNKRKTRTGSSSSRQDSTMVTGDTAKRDKFLERNRVAASKCRQRKKEWVNGLEEAKNGLETQNAHLQMEYNGLLGEVSRMKNQIMAHANCHDPNIDKWIENEARKFVQGQPPSEYPPPVGFGGFPNPGPPPPPFAVNYQGYPEDGSRIPRVDSVSVSPKQMPGRMSGVETTAMFVPNASPVTINR